MNSVKLFFLVLLGKFLLFLRGWKYQKPTFLKKVKKAVLIGVPHKSNWDAFYGLSWAYANKIPVVFIIKKEAMFFPLNLWLSFLGAFPINRGNTTVSTVDQVVSKFKITDSMYLAISPEGTRKDVSEWKTGFYRIAELSSIPIIPTYLDYKNKYIGYLEPFYPTGDLEKDIEYIKSEYKAKIGTYPGSGIK